MNTIAKRIDPALLEGKEPLATGYKVFNWDWTGYGDYCYADDNGNVEGSVHTVTGKISECNWGLHYCINPLDCMRYRDVIQWNKFAVVEAYDENINGTDKSVCRTLKIKKVLSFSEMVKACKSYQKDAAESTNKGISGGYGIRYGYGIRDSYGICNGYGIRDSYGISYGSGIRNGSGIRDSYGICNGSGISDSYGICNGSGISGGYGIRNGYGISNGSGIRDSYGICNGYGVNMSMYCHECEGISRCIFCIGLEGAKLMLFNKPVSEDRFGEAWAALNGWWPVFTNAYKLKEKYGNGEWEQTPAPAIVGRTAKEVYAEMPDELREYIKAMPEYDDEIFRAITEAEW